MGMVLGALIGYTFIENRRIRLIYWGVGIPLLYLLAGGCAWLFIPLIWITEFCRFAGRRLPWWILVGGTLGIAGVTYWISLAVFPYPADRLLWAIGSYRFPLVFPQMQVIAWLAVILVPLLVARLPEDDLEILLGSMGSAIYPDVVCFESVWQIRYRVE